MDWSRFRILRAVLYNFATAAPRSLHDNGSRDTLTKDLKPLTHNLFPMILLPDAS
jgi:hypothetical protein